MANLIELEQWEEGIYQLETDDPVLGGEDGIDNLQAKQLSNRTRWLKAQLLLRALIDSPEFTGTPKVPTAAPGTNNTQAASTAFTKAAIDAAIAALVDSSPGALDTLNELAAALGDDPNFATTITNALALKAPWSTLDEVITAAGMTPDHGILTQLRDAIQTLISQNQQSVIIHDAVFEATVADEDVVYWHAGTGEFTKALADGSAAQNAVGFADVTNEKVYAFGSAPIFAGLTPGAYYLDTVTPGAITATPPAINIVKLGLAISATEIYVDIDKQDSTQITHGLTHVTATGNYTVPAGITQIFVELWGGGGGGGSGSGGAGGGGGGGGGYAAGWLAVTPGQVIACTIGAGGSAASGGATGGAGGTTSFGAFLSATGGTGGGGSGGNGGKGGGGSGGDVVYTAASADSAATNRGGTGSSAPRGGSGGGGGSGVGGSGGLPGGGGGGGGVSSNSGAGAAGRILVHY